MYLFLIYTPVMSMKTVFLHEGLNKIATHKMVEILLLC